MIRQRCNSLFIKLLQKSGNKLQYSHIPSRERLKADKYLHPGDAGCKTLAPQPAVNPAVLSANFRVW